MMDEKKDMNQLKGDADQKAVSNSAPEEKKDSAAVAKARAAEETAVAKEKTEQAGEATASAGAEKSGADRTQEAKAKERADAQAKAGEPAGAKADAAAKAKAAAAAKAKAAAAAKAKAAAAAKAKAQAAKKDAAEEEEKPSPNQPYLDKYVKVIGEHLGKEVLEDYYINRQSKDVPTLVVKRDQYYRVAEFLKYNEQLGFDYLSELHGTDFMTHMEVYVHLYSFKNKQSVALKVKLDRDEPVIESLAPLWAGAEWPECEAYDLLGIKFENHPNLRRILLGEDWVGYPLRKDYKPYDVEE